MKNVNYVGWTPVSLLLLLFLSVQAKFNNPDGLGATVHNDGSMMGGGCREDAGQEW